MPFLKIKCLCCAFIVDIDTIIQHSPQHNNKYTMIPTISCLFFFLFKQSCESLVHGLSSFVIVPACLSLDVFCIINHCQLDNVLSHVRCEQGNKIDEVVKFCFVLKGNKGFRFTGWAKCHLSNVGANLSNDHTALSCVHNLTYIHHFDISNRVDFFSKTFPRDLIYIFYDQWFTFALSF